MAKYDIAASMNGIMTSPSYQAVFAKPQFNKTAAKKEDKEDDKKSKGKPEKVEEKGKGKAEKKDEKGKVKGKVEKPEAKKDKCDVKDFKKDKKEEKLKKDEKLKAKKANLYKACVLGLARISEILDNDGLEKEATYALLALDGLVKSAQVDPITFPTDTIKGTVDKSNAADTIVFPADTIKGNAPVNNANDCEYCDEDCEDVREEKFPELKDEIGSPELWSDEEIEEALPTEEGEEDAMLENVPMVDIEEDDIDKLLAELGEEDNKEDEEEEEEEAPTTIRGVAPAGRGNLTELGRIAYSNLSSLQKLAFELEETHSFLAVKAAGEKDPKAKVRNKPDAIFGDKHPKVKDDKDHFPIDTIGRARNALARVQQFSSAPPWWKGSLEELQKAVSRAVKKKYPSINVGGKDKKKD